MDQSIQKGGMVLHFGRMTGLVFPRITGTFTFGLHQLDEAQYFNLIKGNAILIQGQAQKKTASKPGKASTRSASEKRTKSHLIPMNQGRGKKKKPKER